MLENGRSWSNVTPKIRPLIRIHAPDQPGGRIDPRVSGASNSGISGPYGGAVVRFFRLLLPASVDPTERAEISISVREIAGDYSQAPDRLYARGGKTGRQPRRAATANPD